MIEDMFDAFGDDPKFMEFVNKMVDKMVIDTNNDLKFGNLEVDSPLVGATLLMIIRNQISFEFLRTLNMVLNGNDENCFCKCN